MNWLEFIYNSRCNAAWLLDRHLLPALVRFPQLASEAVTINAENAAPFSRVGYVTFTGRCLWLMRIGPAVQLFFIKAAFVANHIM